MFQLDGKQKYGINVFKVQEIIPYRPLTRISDANPMVKGIATLRGKTMSIIDLSHAITGRPLAQPDKGFIIVSEYNRSVHGFLVNRVERIVNTQWDQVHHLPPQMGDNAYATAVTMLDGGDTIVEILDVEKVFDTILHPTTEVAEDLRAQALQPGHKVIVVDDSSVARNQIRRALEQLQVEPLFYIDGQEAQSGLQGLLDQGVDVAKEYAMVICDIEMPRMDGYSLVAWIRLQPQLRSLYVLMHSSISGALNVNTVQRIGANDFLQKYHPDDLARAVIARIKEKEQHDL